MQDLHILPKLRDSLSYDYAKRAVVQRFRNAVERLDENGKAAVPAASLLDMLEEPAPDYAADGALPGPLIDDTDWDALFEADEAWSR